MQTLNNSQSWQKFKAYFPTYILPIYEQHEANFDFFGYHGRRHITRSIIFAEMMARFYDQQGEHDIDFEGIRIAVSFHDSAREANGRDYWELESSENCMNYLLEAGKPVEYARQVSQTILAKKHNVKTRISQIVYDSDVLEIMRLFTDREDGYRQFRADELFFLGDNELHRSFNGNLLNQREDFINEAWQFIRETENANLNLGNSAFLSTYTNFFERDKKKYPLMNEMWAVNKSKT